jgi:NAD-dependent deacetylase
LRAETLDPSLEMTLAYAKPSRVHMRLADLERRGCLHGIVTQNIDGLHQLAGSRRVVELHGSWKTKIIKFGDPIPHEVLAEAEGLMFGADLVLVLGTSLSVEPAGSLPFLAHCAGAWVIVVNDMETKADDFASIKLNSLDEFLRQTEDLIVPDD